ncbi:MAG TPA: glutamine synthetase family protein [Acidimicrobiales bacterium]|nr:glutamine synthetase family protein [Acidimicrobiales bacterium]
MSDAEQGLDAYGRIRVLWPDHLGLARGKYVPLDQLGRVRHCTGTWALGYSREMVPGAPGSHFFEGLPDMEAKVDPSEVRPGWEEHTGVVVADLFEHGEPVAVAPRSALRRAIGAWEARGYAPEVGIELEAYLLEPDGDGGWRPLDTPGAFVYGTGSAVDPAGVIDEIWEVAGRSGLPIEAVNSEYDTPQFEFTLAHRDAMRAADDTFLFKVLAREVARRHGMLLTFMGKPFSDRGGSGLHVNLSLLRPDGSNAFDDPEAEDGMSSLAKSCIAGLVEHHEALTGLLAPTVNAYKRLVPGLLAGCFANWGHDHRCATVRVPPERGGGARLEHRLADGAVVVHTAVAAALQAALLGVTDELTCPPPERSDGLESSDSGRCSPPDLASALDVLEADKALCDAVGSELVSLHLAIKRAEWDRYRRATTDWELREYLPFL